MGFWDELIKGVSDVAGTVVGGGVSLVGEVTGSAFLKEVGEGVYKSTKLAGERLGQAVDGVLDVAIGVATGDSGQVDKGANNVIDSVSKTVQGVGTSIVNFADNAVDVLDGLVQGDYHRVAESGRKVATQVAVTSLTVSPLVLVDFGIDATVDHNLVDGHEGTPVDNPNVHHVNPYWRHNADGSESWIDGNPDPTIHDARGWYQMNPDYRK